MESLKNNSTVNHLRKELLETYRKNLVDKTFSDLVIKNKIKEEVGSLYNSDLEDSVGELKNCSQCKGLFECKNKVMGHYLYPKLMGKIIDLVYVPCQYKKENDKLLEVKNTANKEFLQARFKNIDVFPERISLKSSIRGITC